MKEILRELSTECQTLCNEGFSDSQVYINVQGSLYKVGNIHMVVHKDESISFEIIAKTWEEQNE